MSTSRGAFGLRLAPPSRLVPATAPSASVSSGQSDTWCYRPFTLGRTKREEAVRRPAKAGAKAPGPSGRTLARAWSCHSIAGPGSPASVGVSEDGGLNLVFPSVGRGSLEQGRNVRFGCGLRWRPFRCGRALHRRAPLQSKIGSKRCSPGNPCAFREEKLWMDYGCAHLSVWKGGFA